MESAKRIFLFLWLVLFGVAHALAAFFDVSASPVGEAYIGYDAIIAYDGSQNSSSAYEDAARPPTGDEKHASGAARTFLNRIADLVAAESSAVAARNTTTSIGSFYPANNGFIGATESKFLMPGTVIDRYGGSGMSRFFAKAGTPDVMRSLPPGTAGQTLRSFEVVKPFPVDAGAVAPAYGQMGLGEQYVTPVTLDVLLKRGILNEL